MPCWFDLYRFTFATWRRIVYGFRTIKLNIARLWNKTYHFRNYYVYITWRESYLRFFLYVKFINQILFILSYKNEPKTTTYWTIATKTINQQPKTRLHHQLITWPVRDHLRKASSNLVRIKQPLHTRTAENTIWTQFFVWVHVYTRVIVPPTATATVRSFS